METVREEETEAKAQEILKLLTRKSVHQEEVVVSDQ